MEQDSQAYRDALRSQIRDEYGRLTYTYTCHNKQANINDAYARRISWGQLILSIVSTCSVMSLFVHEGKVQLWVAVISSALLALISAFDKDRSFSANSRAHGETAEELWLIREKYISLLTDFENLESSEICKARDSLLAETHSIYKRAPKTSEKAYRATQRALKNDEEQFFTDEELDSMLPKKLRMTGRPNNAD